MFFLPKVIKNITAAAIVLKLYTTEKKLIAENKQNFKIC